MTWGILATDTVVSLRRQRDLGLAAAVREFNDRSVPGVGSLWFPMPVLWSVLAVSIAEALDRAALPIGNAIEALVMQRARHDGVDPRLRGKQKLSDVRDNSFATLSRRDVYVVQPIRMGIVQPLAELGFVTGTRYNSFRIAAAGERLLQLPEVAECRNVLAAWVQGGKLTRQASILDRLSPLTAVPSAVRKAIRAQMLDAPLARAERRRNLVALGGGPSVTELLSPAPLREIERKHWIDLRAGVSLVDLRSAALAVLDLLETKLIERRDARNGAVLSAVEASRLASDALSRLRALATSQKDRIEAAEEADSRKFLSEILSSPTNGSTRWGEL